MADEVSVKFTGSIEGIQTSVTQIREFLQGLEAPIRGVRAQLGELADAFIAAFAVEKIKSFAEAMGELGTKTASAAAVLGSSTEDIGALSLMAQASGISLDTLVSSFGRLSRSVIEQSDVTKRALAALGLSFADLRNKSAMDQFSVIANAMSGIEDGSNKAAIAVALFGRAGEQLIPFMNEGAGAIQRWAGVAQDMGVALKKDVVQALEGTHEAFVTLSAAMKGAGISIFLEFQGAINGTIKVVTDLVSSFIEAYREGGMVRDIMDLLAVAAKGLVTGLAGVIALMKGVWSAATFTADAVFIAFRGLGQSIGDIWGTLAGGIGTFFSNLVAAAAEAVQAIGRTFVNLGAVISAALHGDFGGASTAFDKLKEDASAAGTSIGQSLKNSLSGFDLAKVTADFNRVMGELRTRQTQYSGEIAATYKKLMDEIEAIWGTGTKRIEEQRKKAGEMASPTDRDAVKTAEREIDGQIQVLRRGLTERQAMLEAEASLYGLTQDRKFALLQVETEKEYQAELKLLQQKRAIRGLEPSEVQKIDNDIANLRATHRTTMLNLDVQSIRSMAQQYENVLGTITGAFNSQLRGLLAGTTHFKDAFKSMLGDIMISFIQAVEQMAVKWAAKEIAQTTASVMGASARASASAAADAAGWTSTITNALRSIGASLGMTFAGVSANQAPLLGPAAPAEAAAVTAAVDAAAMGFLSLDVGAWRLPSDGLAMFHRDEMVVPATFAEGLRNNGGLGGGGGDTHNHFNFPGVMDTRGFLAAIKAHDSPIAKMLSKAMTNNRSARPAF